MARAQHSVQDASTLLSLEDCDHQDRHYRGGGYTASRQRQGLFSCFGGSCFGGRHADVDASVHVPHQDNVDCIIHHEQLDCIIHHSSNGSANGLAAAHAAQLHAGNPGKTAAAAGAAGAAGSQGGKAWWGLHPPSNISAVATSGPAAPDSALARRNSGGCSPWMSPTAGAGAGPRRCASAASEWHDALSHLSDSSSEPPDQAAQLQEVDRLVKELGAFKAPYVPDPPLLFGSPGMQFVPVPSLMRLEAFWERIEERTSPFPQPIDVMLKANFLVQKTHKSIDGLLIHETDKNVRITAIPNWLPPGVSVGYEETYDKSNVADSHWNLRRDMKLGSCTGRLYMTVDGTIVLRVASRGLWSSEVEIITEDYLTLEEEGDVLVDKMCALHIPSGKRATQYQVGRRRTLPFKHYK